MIPALLTLALLAAAPDRPPVHALLPEDTLFLLASDDTAALSASFGRTSWGRVLAEPEVKWFLFEMRDRLHDAGMPDRGDARIARSFLALTHLDPGDVGLVAGLEGEGDVAAWRDWLGVLLRRITPLFRATGLIGVEDPVLFTTHAGGFHLVSLSQKALDAVAMRARGEEAPSLGDDASFAAARAHLELDALPSGYLFANLERLAPEIVPFLRDKRLAKVATRLELSGLNAFAASFTEWNGVTIERAWLGHDGPGSGVAALSPDQVLRRELLALVPEDAIAFQFFSLDPVAAADLADELGFLVPSFQRNRAFLAEIGPRFLVIHPTGPRSSSMLPAFVVCAEVRDEQVVLDGLSDLLEDLDHPALGQMIVERPEPGAPPMHWVRLENFPLNPAFVVHEGWLVVAGDVLTLKSQIARMQGGGLDVTANEAFDAALAEIVSPHETVLGVSYADVPALIARWLDSVWMLAGRSTAFEVALVPSEEIALLFEPTVAASCSVADGWLFTRRGPLGGETLGIGAAAGGFGAAVGLSRLLVQIEELAGHGGGPLDADLQYLVYAVRAYHSVHDAFPENLDVLAEADPANDGCRYVDGPARLRDRWGNPFRLVAGKGARFAVVSLGADGLPGGEGEDRDLSSDGSEGR